MLVLIEFSGGVLIYSGSILLVYTNLKGAHSNA